MRMVDAPVDTEKKVNRLEDVLPPDLGCTVTYSAMNAYACMTSRGPLSSGRPSPRRSQRYAPTREADAHYYFEDGRPQERDHRSEVARCLSDGTSDGR